MALTLTATLGVPTTLDQAIRLTVTGTVPDAIEAGYQFRLEDEVLQLRYFGKTQEDILGGAATQTVDDRNVWYAQRGLNGTTIASHAATTALLGVADPALVAGDDEDPPSPFATGGGGGPHSTTHEDAGADEVRTRVTDTVEDVEASEIVVVFAPGGGATLADTLAAGNDTGGTPIVNVAPVDTTADVSAAATATGSGAATADRVATSADGNASARTEVTASGGGNVDGRTEATTTDGSADVSITADSGGFLAKAKSTAESGGSGLADVTAEANAGGTGSATAKRRAIAAGGDANADTTATTTGDGSAYARTTATGSGSGEAIATLEAIAAGGSASIGPVAGATTALIMVTGLPTSDPVVAGALWNDTGTLKVSAG